MLPYVLLILGLLMIFSEFYLPGGVLGTVGGVTVLVSIIFYALHSDSPIGIALFTLVALASVALLFRFALWRIRSGKSGIYEEGDQGGYIASNYDKEVIGKVGVVESDLKPGGHVVVEGKKHGAISLSGYITKGEKILVIGGEGESLTVKHYKEG